MHYEAILIGTRQAAAQCHISVTHFQRLAQQLPQITPIRITGSPVVAWTPDLIKRVAERRKR